MQSKFQRFSGGIEYPDDVNNCQNTKRRGFETRWGFSVWAGAQGRLGEQRDDGPQEPNDAGAKLPAPPGVW